MLLAQSNNIERVVRLAHCTAAGATRAMSSSSAPLQVAVIGAGIAGAVCSSLLARKGVKVDVFDLGRQVPGAVAVMYSATTPNAL